MDNINEKVSNTCEVNEKVYKIDDDDKKKILILLDTLALQSKILPELSYKYLTSLSNNNKEEIINIINYLYEFSKKENTFGIVESSMIGYLIYKIKNN